MIVLKVNFLRRYVLISAKSGIHPNPGAVFVSPDAPH